MAILIANVPRGTVAAPAVVALARRLRAVSTALEAGLAIVVAGSVFAMGAVHAWARLPLFCVTAGLALLVAVRVALVHRLRTHLGRCRFAIHSSDRWLVLDDDASYGVPTWSFNLDRPIWPPGPLLIPGAVFLAWTLAQTIPVPSTIHRGLAGPDPATEAGHWASLTVSPAQTLRGAAFLVWAIVLHSVAAVALDRRETGDRFCSLLPWLGFTVALVGLVQYATRTRLVYGFFKPVEGTGEMIFGRFVNRNHFATYMLLVAPLAFGLLAARYGRYRARVGSRPNFRRRMVAIASPEGLAVLYAVIPTLATVGALVATTSRGGLLAFAGGLAVAGIGLLRRRSVRTGVGGSRHHGRDAVVVRSGANPGADRSPGRGQPGSDRGVGGRAATSRRSVARRVRVQYLRLCRHANHLLEPPRGRHGLARAVRVDDRRRSSRRVPCARRYPGVRLVPRGP